MTYKNAIYRIHRLQKIVAKSGSLNQADLWDLVAVLEFILKVLPHAGEDVED